MSNDLKTTALTHVHEALSAKMVPFAGYSMPVQYSGLKLEHAAVREAAGMFDVSHMGECFVDGPQALDFLQLVTSNDVSRLLPGKIQYSCMPNAQGGIVDDLLVQITTEISESNPSLQDKIMQRFTKVKEMKYKIINLNWDERQGIIVKNIGRRRGFTFRDGKTLEQALEYHKGVDASI